MLPYFLIMLAAFAADRLTKWWVLENLSPNGTIPVTDWLSWHLTFNRGVAFGMFQGLGQLVGWLTLFVLVGMFVYLLRLPRELWLMRLGLALVVGGAAGNLIDRVYVGQVVDFIALSFLPWVFNVADIAIDGGMVVVLLGSFLQKAPEEKMQESAGAGEQGSEGA